MTLYDRSAKQFLWSPYSSNYRNFVYSFIYIYIVSISHVFGDRNDDTPHFVLDVIGFQIFEISMFVVGILYCIICIINCVLLMRLFLYALHWYF